jgi:hypothetical protein
MPGGDTLLQEKGDIPGNSNSYASASGISPLLLLLI